ncbi:ABC transporter ATP-binding protein [Shinella sp.]|uniref:ABC transporter ATP-binding protein n=1 Tax=Shinella sp. TaxID=1870904 RepID=UPI0029B50AD8|nr:ABC transporter ATP-binding protein [Shinella sp.]MDX3974760.1 ABC transporter ATP-binding protein [Shinella sp.]
MYNGLDPTLPPLSARRPSTHEEGDAPVNENASAAHGTADKLLSVRDLSITAGGLTLVNGVSFDLKAGTTTALVGESGSGKSLTAQAILGLLNPQIYMVSGTALTFQGKPLHFDGRQPPAGFSGRLTGFVMQDPSSALDPTMTVGRQIAEMFIVHRGLGMRAALREAARMLDFVRIPDAAARIGDYPHQFSGGMKQRVLIAMAVALSPRLLVADEPTTALDVTVQAEILTLIDDLRAELDMTVLIITHDFGVVYQCADRTLVMYAGKLVEGGETLQVTESGRHPYTRGLIDSIPDIDDLDRPVVAIPGQPPRAGRNWSDSCAFHSRCGWRAERCLSHTPEMESLANGAAIRCFEWRRAISEARA